MALDVGNIQATLKLDVSNFERGIKNAKTEVDDLGKSMRSDLSDSAKTAETSTDNLNRSIEKTTDSVNDLSRDVQTADKRLDEFTESVKDGKTQTDSLQSAVDNATDSIKKEGESADTSSSKIGFLGNESGNTTSLLDKMKGILGAIGVTIGISELITKIKELGERAFEAHKRVQDLVATINAGTGATGEQLKEMQEIANEISRELGDDSAEVGALVAGLNTYYGIEGDQLRVFAREYQSFIDQIEKAGGQVTLTELQDVFKKWNVPLSENLQYLGMWYEIAQKTNVSMSDMLGLLADGDRAFSLLGMDIETASNWIGAFSKNAEYSDIVELTNAVERIASLKAEELGSESEAKAYVQQMYRDLTTLKDEEQITSMLISQFGVNARVAGSIAGALASSTIQSGLDYTKLYDVRDSLAYQNITYRTSEQQETVNQQNIDKILEDTGLTAIAEWDNEKRNRLWEGLATENKGLRGMLDTIIGLGGMFDINPLHQVGYNLLYDYLKEEDLKQYNGLTQNITINGNVTNASDTFHESERLLHREGQAVQLT